MSDREEFEKWAKDAGYKTDLVSSGYKYMLTHQAWQFWQIRQPEIDALKDKLESLEAQMEAVGSIERELRNELARIQAENERLRKDTVKAVFAMIDPLNPPGAPGSYARGEHNGIVAAGRTLKDAIGVAMREAK